jgi:hypothetical protein
MAVSCVTYLIRSMLIPVAHHIIPVTYNPMGAKKKEGKRCV